MSSLANQFPQEEPQHLRIAIIEGIPSKEEVDYNKLFIGATGRLLTSLLIQAGVRRDECFFGSVANEACETDDYTKLDGLRLQEARLRLKQDLQTFGPDVCILLGKTSLQAAGVSTSLFSYRGTMFDCVEINSPMYGYTCIASYDLKYILRGNNREAVVLLADINKAMKTINAGQALAVPSRRFELNLGADEIVAKLSEIEVSRPLVSFDIEGGVDGITCCSVSVDPLSGFVIPFYYGKENAFSELDEQKVWVALSRMLMNPQVPKVLQNSLYDSFVLAWNRQILIANVQEDTMLKHWELFPELEKGLGFQCSYYTQEPYYKDERTVPDKTTYHAYCCKDSAVTLEICRVQEGLLKARDSAVFDHYRFNMDMLRPLLYMELRGIRYDRDKALQRIQELTVRQQELQLLINAANGGQYLNTSSSKQMLAFLSKQGFELPINRKTGNPTADYEAILSLAKKHGNEHPYFLPILEVKSIRTRVQMLNIRADGDGRIRCGYNVVGTDTGRLTCYTSPTGSGYNLQTIPNYDRDLFLADEDHWLFQCDLSGADAWTVAAWCAKLGDPTMLDDLREGIKVAKVLAAMTLEGAHIASFPRDLVAAYAAKVKKEDPIYFGSKCVQHGSNYGMGKNLMSSLIFIQSEGKILMTPKECQNMQDCYFRRYPGVKRWHEFVQSRLIHTGKLTSASGHVRPFGGDKRSHETFKAALANEPQENTTYATNLAAHRLWTDPENRRPDGGLYIEPLHQVHDALIGQFPKSRTEWAVAKIRSYFDNTLTIAGQPIKIPFEGGFGVSWGEQTAGVI